MTRSVRLRGLAVAATVLGPVHLRPLSLPVSRGLESSGLHPCLWARTEREAGGSAAWFCPQGYRSGFEACGYSRAGGLCTFSVLFYSQFWQVI